MTKTFSELFLLLNLLKRLPKPYTQCQGGSTQNEMWQVQIIQSHPHSRAANLKFSQCVIFLEKLKFSRSFGMQMCSPQSENFCKKASLKMSEKWRNLFTNLWSAHQGWPFCSLCCLKKCRLAALPVALLLLLDGLAIVPSLNFQRRFIKRQEIGLIRRKIRSNR